MIIGFTTKTSKFISKLLCKKFRHCVVILEPDETGIKNTYLLIQVASNGIKVISIRASGLQKLKAAGWVLVSAKINTERQMQRHISCASPAMLSCVGFAKRALSINKPFIWTPDGLYRYLNK